MCRKNSVFNKNMCNPEAGTGNFKKQLRNSITCLVKVKKKTWSPYGFLVYEAL